MSKQTSPNDPDTITAYEYTFTTTRTTSGYTCTVTDDESDICPPVCNWTAPTRAEAIEGAAALIDASFVCDESETAGDAVYNIRELALDKLEAAGIKSTPEVEYRLTTWAQNYVSSSHREHWTDDHAAELAAVEAAAPEALASEGNPEDAVNLIAYTVFAALNNGATPDTYDDNDMEQLDRLMGYASEIVRRDGPAHGIQWAPYQRYELEAFLGEPDDYDVDAIEAEATAYDYSTGRTYWTAFGDDLAAIAERHELYAYAPAI